MKIQAQSRLDECPFCSACTEADDALPWYDEPLFREPGGAVAIAAVGALVPGYLLAAPRCHVPSLRRLPRADAALFLQFIDDVRNRIEARFGPTTLFEHGSCVHESRRRSACLVHSHIHLVPGHYSLAGLGLVVDEYSTLTEAVDRSPGDAVDGYLLYQEPGGAVCLASDPGVSQFFRRHIAQVLGQPDEWDYAMFPRWENVRRTHEWIRCEQHGAA